MMHADPPPAQRAGSPAPPPLPGHDASSTSRGRHAVQQRRWKKLRCAFSDERVDVRGIPPVVPSLINAAQLAQLVRLVRIDDLSQKLRANQFIPPDGERSPSPPPEFDRDGRRTNTREARYRRRCEDERHRLIEQASQADPFYRPPSDYRRSRVVRAVGADGSATMMPIGGSSSSSSAPGLYGSLADKVYIPKLEFPDVNFIGLLIGPRGRTLQKIEADCGVKISIRGRGAHKEGRTTRSREAVGEDDEMHALVMGDNPQGIVRGVQMVTDIIVQACSTPETANELKLRQLRELAALNGTLRDDEVMCAVCSQFGHEHYECPTKNGGTGEDAASSPGDANQDLLASLQGKSDGERARALGIDLAQTPWVNGTGHGDAPRARHNDGYADDRDRRRDEDRRREIDSDRYRGQDHAAAPVSSAAPPAAAPGHYPPQHQQPQQPQQQPQAYVDPTVLMQQDPEAYAAWYYQQMQQDPAYQQYYWQQYYAQQQQQQQ